jgi:Glycoside hydrolase 123, catalytic domain
MLLDGPRMRTLLVSTVLLVAASANAQSVWVAPSTEKIRPQAAAGAATSVALEAARNEFEAFHVVVSGPVAAVTVTAPALAGPGGAVLDGAHVFREAWINLATESNVGGANGRWPDALIPAVDEIAGEARNAFPMTVPAGEQQPVFVEYFVPADAAPGVYRGVVHVAGGGLAVDVPVTLAVHAFSLPSTASLRSAFGIGWNDACTAHFGSFAACGGDAGVEKMLAMYSRFALDHRVTLSESVYTGPPAAASGYDWAAWDAKYAALLDGGAPTRLHGARLTSLRYTWSPDATHYGEWAQHFRARGWLDRTFAYVCDEPPAGCAWSDINARAAAVHAGDAAFRTLTTTTLDRATQNGVLGALDVLVPVLNDVPDAATRAAYDAWLGGGARQLWWYQSCMSDGCAIVGGPETVGWPSYMIDAPATLHRAMEWQSWQRRMQGELYYDTTYAFPRGDAWANQYYFGGNGDGTLFYPGTPAKIGGATDVPIASLRLKMIREGMEDYEYLKLLADSGDAALADAEAAALSPAAKQFTQDPGAIDAARHRIAARIDQLLGLPAPDAMGGGSGGSGGTSPMNPDPAGGGGSGVGGGGGSSGSGAGGHASGGCSLAPGARAPAAGLGLSIVVACALALLRRRRAP